MKQEQIEHKREKILISNTWKLLLLINIVSISIPIYFLFTNPDTRVVFWGLLLGVLFSSVFQVFKYKISDQNTIEFYNLIGRSKSRTIHISCISALEVKTSNKMSIEYSTQKDGYPQFFLFLLKPNDIQYLKNELLNRNPNIEVV